MYSFTDYIEELIDKHEGMTGYRVTQDDIANAIGKKQGSVSLMFSKKRNLKEADFKRVLTKIFRYSNPEAEEAVFKVKSKALATEAEKAGLGPLVTVENLPEDTWAEVPLLGSINCGNFLESEVIGTMLFPRHLLTPGKSYRAAKAVGDSMSTKINEGDVVLIELTNEIIKDKVMACCIRGSFALGYVQRGDDFVVVSKENPLFKPKEIKDPDFEVVGWVKASLNQSF